MFECKALNIRKFILILIPHSHVNMALRQQMLQNGYAPLYETAVGGLYEQDNSSFSTKVKRVGDLNSLGEITLEVGTQTLPLRELATISREYPESSYGSVFPQGNGFFLQILRNVDEDTIEVTSKIKSVIEALRSEISPMFQFSYMTQGPIRLASVCGSY